MSASRIPNLNTLRRGGGGRGRGAGRPGGTLRHPGGNGSGNGDDPLLPTRFATNGFRIPQTPLVHTPDTAVQKTDLDAARSRLEIQRLGYVQDDFVSWFTKAAQQPISGQGPKTEKNRGTFLRTWVVDHLLEAFLKPTAAESSDSWPHERLLRRQIVSLGAGTDTRYFRLLQKQNLTRDPSTTPTTGPSTSSTRPIELRYHEIDFQEVTRQKVTVLNDPNFAAHVHAQSSVDLRSARQLPDSASYHSSNGYHLHPFDLRTLRGAAADMAQDPDSLGRLFEGLDSSVPTVILSELCLMYLAESEAESVLQGFVNIFPSRTPIGLVMLEPIRPSDAFGHQMISSMAEQNVHFTTIKRFPELTDQRERLESLGLRTHNGYIGAAEAVDWWTLWNEWLDEEKRREAEAKEPLEEIEYWRDLFQHYCLAWAYRDGTSVHGDSPFSAWFARTPTGTEIR